MSERCPLCKCAAIRMRGSRDWYCNTNGCQVIYFISKCEANKDREEVRRAAKDKGATK
jgi:hypothetical protein